MKTFAELLASGEVNKIINKIRSLGKHSDEKEKQLCKEFNISSDTLHEVLDYALEQLTGSVQMTDSMKETFNNHMEKIKVIVKEAGFPVQMGSDFCTKFLAEHNDKCKGCESESGCCRVHLMGQTTMGVYANLRPKTMPEMMAAAGITHQIYQEILDKGLSLVSDSAASETDYLSGKTFDDKI